MTDDSYKGDLEGMQAPHAAAMRCGACLCGDLIGVDLLDATGKTMAHGHLAIESALTFAEDFAAAIAAANEHRRAAMNPEVH